MMRDDIATCPACGRGLDPSGLRLCCSGCGGVLVIEDELRALISEMQAGKLVGPAGTLTLSFEPADRAEAPRTCPRCPAQMTKHTLYGMLVDRCEAHGVWFDAAELQAALARVGAEASRLPLRHKVAMTAAGVGWLAFLIASAIVGPGR